MLVDDTKIHSSISSDKDFLCRMISVQYYKVVLSVPNGFKQEFIISIYIMNSCLNYSLISAASTVCLYGNCTLPSSHYIISSGEEDQDISFMRVYEQSDLGVLFTLSFKLEPAFTILCR